VITSGIRWRIIEDRCTDAGDGRRKALEILGGGEVANLAVRVCRPAETIVNGGNGPAGSCSACLYTIELASSPAAKVFYRDALGLVPAISEGASCGTSGSARPVLDLVDSAVVAVSRLSISNDAVAVGKAVADPAAQTANVGLVGTGTAFEASAASATTSAVDVVDLAAGEGPLGPVCAPRCALLHRLLTAVIGHHPLHTWSKHTWSKLRFFTSVVYKWLNLESVPPVESFIHPDESFMPLSEGQPSSWRTTPFHFRPHTSITCTF
jgi:hypothetical protein